jgi:hypothetical protein
MVQPKASEAARGARHFESSLSFDVFPKKVSRLSVSESQWRTLQVAAKERMDKKGRQEC